MRHHYIIYILFASLFLGCKNDEVVSVQSYTKLTGRLQGTMYLGKDDGWFSSNHQGILVEIEHTSFKTTTDSNGFWEIDNLPTGTYSISFSKEGYCFWKNTSFQFIGGGVIDFNEAAFGSAYSSVGLGVKPDYTLTIDSVMPPIWDAVANKWIAGKLISHTSKITKSGWIQINYSISPSPDVIYRNTAFQRLNIKFAGSDTIVSVSTPLFYEDVYAALRSDTIGYVRAYPKTLKILDNILDSYIDWTSGEYVFSGYGESSNIVATKFR